MEVEGSHECDSIRKTLSRTETTRIDTSKSMPNSVAQHVSKDEDGIENGSHSDYDSGSCPLFMTGLPQNFATNPQLAAIASLLNDEDEEEVDDDANNDDGDKERQDGRQGPLASSHQLSSATIIPVGGRGHSTNLRFTRAQNRRRQQRSSPYPRQNQTNENGQKKRKSGSVGEITLFMNMWKP